MILIFEEAISGAEIMEAMPVPAMIVEVSERNLRREVSYVLIKVKDK